MVEVAQALQTQVTDPVRTELTAPRFDRQLDAVDQRLDVGRADLTLVRRSQQRRPELGPVEALALAVAL
jgi:hypothetical protein